MTNLTAIPGQVSFDEFVDIMNDQNLWFWFSVMVQIYSD